MVEFLKSLKSKFPFIWMFIEAFNSLIVNLLFGKKINRSLNKFLPCTDSHNYLYRPILEDDIDKLVEMMDNQPKGFDEFFKPHSFDKEGFMKAFKTKSFIMIGTFDADKIIGYCFIRCFANGKAFRGKMVDVNYQGKGIAKQMGLVMTDIAFGAGFRLFATISKKNVRSMAASKAVNRMKIIKELKDDYYYIEYLPKNN